MKFVFRGVSGAALLLGLGGLQGAWAQQGTATPAPTAPQNQTVTTAPATAPANDRLVNAGPQNGSPAPQAATPADQTVTPADQTTGERVIVTGSLIATLPEDAPKPVEVYTAEDLKAQGQPSVSEFVRSLTVNYGSDLSFGQASQDVPTGAGFVNADLRGLGPNGTLVLMNGRRLATTNGGFGADLNTVPMEALQAVEVLKDGASTTYGAGAVGGVLNFRTRRDIDAPTITYERTLYDGSKGEYNFDFQTGWVGDAGNILMSFHYGHTDSMPQTKRDFSSLPFTVNPTVYSLNAPNPGRFHASQNFYTATAPTGVTGVNAAAAVNDLPGSTGVAATAACRAVGGEIVANLNNSAATGTGTACALKQFYFQDLVNENDNYRFYGEANFDLTDTMEFTLSTTYSKGETKRHDIPTLAPINRATDADVSRTGPSALQGGNCLASCQFVIPVQVQTYSQPNLTTAGTPTGVFTRNPFIDDFMTRTGVTAVALPNTGALYTAANWRPFGYGGNPLYGNGPKQDRQQRERILITTGLNGEFAGDTLLGQWLNGIKYDYSAQFNTYLDTGIRPDVSVARLQNALAGYGGFGCNATDIVPTDYSSAQAFNRTVGIQSNTRPGTDGCQWFNPFASGWANSFVTGAANPMFNAANPTLVAGSTARPTGYANPVDLVDWMMVDRVFETQYMSGTFDYVWSGELPDTVALPGGPISWAAGGQWRMTERRSISSNGNTTEERALNMQECPFPDPGVVNQPAEPPQGITQRGCGTGPGAFFGTGDHNESDEDSQTLSWLAEFQLPVLDNLNFQASVRREEYNGGPLTGDIWSLAGKYDVTDNFYVRASYSTNFRAEAALDNPPGEIFQTLTAPARFGGILQFDNFEVIDSNLGPEDDKTFNAGVGYNRDIGDGRLRLAVDFFEITIDGEVTTTGTATVYNNVFGNNSTACQTNRTDPTACGSSNVATGLPGTGTTNSTNQFANCSARLVFLVAFNGNTCTQGVTTANDLAAVIQSTQNGPRRITNGIDYSVDYSHPLFDGTFGVNLTATQNLHWKTQGFDVAGVVFEEAQNRLGFINQSLLVPAVPEWRANATLRWSNDQHSVNLRANYQSGIYDERDPALIGTGIYPSAGTLTDIDAGTAGTQVSMYGVLPQDYIEYNLTYIYTAPFWEELEFRASILNLTDEDPLPAQNRNGYLSGISNPRGRQFELGITKRF